MGKRRYDEAGHYVELDERHRIGKEFMGKATAQWVFRWCDDYQSAHATRREAEAAALAFETARVRQMTGG